MPSRRPAATIAAAGLFAIALLSFALPFSAIHADGLVGEATGFGLARGEAAFAGAPAREETRGDVEERLDRAGWPALVALFGAAAGTVLAWRPYLGVGAATTGLAGLLGIFAATATPLVAAATDRRYGFWLAALSFVAAGACSLAGLRRRG